VLIIVSCEGQRAQGGNSTVRFFVAHAANKGRITCWSRDAPSSLRIIYLFVKKIPRWLRNAMMIEVRNGMHLNHLRVPEAYSDSIPDMICLAKNLSISSLLTFSPVA
jgi:hypothetical protein